MIGLKYLVYAFFIVKYKCIWPRTDYFVGLLGRRSALPVDRRVMDSLIIGGTHLQNPCLRCR